MGKHFFLDDIREFIGTIAFRVLLWSLYMTKEQYYDMTEKHAANIPTHCEHGFNGLCPVCDATQTPPQR